MRALAQLPWQASAFGTSDFQAWDPPAPFLSTEAEAYSSAMQRTWQRAADCIERRFQGEASVLAAQSELAGSRD
ncbi:hypothetical protein GUJ93_ZPchr0012g21378 [Zizania palustris]|uniref:Uncharacterized protein n=1 Tax=Zizania palustris TaxID=103762 RepID=A0A8J5WU34_ZIZPA|nr:hypothetical protein GUJ93_ZPchr0012g21378 [Zizania palustris]